MLDDRGHGRAQNRILGEMPPIAAEVVRKGAGRVGAQGVCKKFFDTASSGGDVVEGASGQIGMTVE